MTLVMMLSLSGRWDSPDSQKYYWDELKLSSNTDDIAAARLGVIEFTFYSLQYFVCWLSCVQ